MELLLDNKQLALLPPPHHLALEITKIGQRKRKEIKVLKIAEIQTSQLFSIEVIFHSIPFEWNMSDDETLPIQAREGIAFPKDFLKIEKITVTYSCFFLLFRGSIRSQLPGPTLVPEVFHNSFHSLNVLSLSEYKPTVTKFPTPPNGQGTNWPSFGYGTL